MGGWREKVGPMGRGTPQSRLLTVTKESLLGAEGEGWSGEEGKGIMESGRKESTCLVPPGCSAHWLSWLHTAPSRLSSLYLPLGLISWSKLTPSKGQPRFKPTLVLECLLCSTCPHHALCRWCEWHFFKKQNGHLMWHLRHFGCGREGSGEGEAEGYLRLAPERPWPPLPRKTVPKTP